MAEIRFRTKETVLENMALGMMLAVALMITVVVFFCILKAASLYIDSNQMSARPTFYVH